MEILLSLSALALRQVLKGATEWTVAKSTVDGGERLAGILMRHFSDHSLKLTQALSRANDRAWKGLEMALIGDSWWARVKNALVPAEAKAFQQQVEAYLDRTALSQTESNTKIRQLCVREMQQARERGLLTGGEMDFKKLSEQLGIFARFDDPQKILEAEWKIVQGVGARIKQAGFSNLSWFVSLRPPRGDSLLVIGVRYFFRREVETDPELFRGLTITKLEALSQAQEESFASLEKQIGELKAAVGKIQTGVENIQAGVAQVQAGVGHVHEDVLDLKAELRRQGQQQEDFRKAVLALLDQHRLNHRQMNTRDGHSIDNDRDRRLVHELIDGYRKLPERERRESPALLNALSKLQVGVGDFDEARRGFQTVAEMVPQPTARADAYCNEYYTALEQGCWDDALAALQKAIDVDPKRFAPFRVDRYEPMKILGAGGFGVAFLCRDRILGSLVVIKVLRADTLARSVNDIFREAQVLDQLNHPSIIRLRHCDYADAEQTRPFFVMDYFEGENLAEYVKKRGPLSNEDLARVATLVAEGLHEAHKKGILHRDVKPHNILVRKGPGQRWELKLIDFGLALEQAMLAGAKTSGSYPRSVLGASIAGTRHFAAPEQLGEMPFPVGPCSDVFGFAKTCCYARFGTLNLVQKHWENLPRQLSDLLSDCLEELPEKRPNGFERVLTTLRRRDLFDPIATVLPVRDAATLVQPVKGSASKPGKSSGARPKLPPVLKPEEDEALAPIEMADNTESIKTVLPVQPTDTDVSVRLLFSGERKVGVFDSMVEVSWDGKFVGSGTISRGFDANVQTTLGRHKIHLQMMFLGRNIEVDLPQPGSYEVKFAYDTTLGVSNFKTQVEVRQIATLI